MPKLLRSATTDHDIAQHQNRVKLEAEHYGNPYRTTGVTSNFGDGFSSLGEYYHHGNGGYCPDRTCCRADATVARNCKKEGRAGGGPESVPGREAPEGMGRAR